MGFTLLDFILFGIMAVSALLALMRGFTREVLSLLAWGLGIVAGYFASQMPQLTNLLLPYLDKPVFAQVAVGIITFLIALIMVSIVSVKISDRVIDSSAGAIDRSMGFIYGLARGLVLVALSYLLYSWAQPPESQEEWIKNAQSLSTIQTTSNFIKSLLPPEIASVLTTIPQAIEATPESVPAPVVPVQP
jgi:membrane protein required for colicin V production